MSGVAGVPWRADALVVRVRGVPRPQPRPRVLKSGRVVSTTGPAAAWKRLVLGEILQAVNDAEWSCLASGPVGLRLVVLFPTKDRKRWGRLRTAVRNADFDNVAKLIADALGTRGVFGDDGQVAAVEQLQVWSPPEKAGVVLRVGPVADGVVLDLADW